MTSRKHKVLYFDIETAPKRAYVWRMWRENVSIPQLISESFVISWAAKWADDDEIVSDHLKPKEIMKQDDKRLVEKLAKLIREADIVVAHNCDGFDVPVVNARLMKWQSEPLGPVRTLDTLKYAKRDLRLASNKLDYLAQFLGLGNKIKTDFELWRRVDELDEDAMALMVTYNRHDVVLLEQVAAKMQRYVRRWPRLQDASDWEEDACPRCGAQDRQKRGFYRTQASTFQQYQCNACGSYFRSRKSIGAKKLEHVPL